MRRFLVAILCLILSISLNAQMKWNSKYQAYIDKYKDLAISEMLKYNIPASITLAQGLLESGAGMSELTRKGNNHFGIKCFRAYRDAYESYEDHSKFLARQPRYKRLFSLKRTDYKGWAHGLKKCGYATNPNYANKLIGIIELYKLHKYDNAKKFDKFMVERSEVKDI